MKIENVHATQLLIFKKGIMIYAEISVNVHHQISLHFYCLITEETLFIWNLLLNFTILLEFYEKIYLILKENKIGTRHLHIYGVPRAPIFT